MHPVLRIGLLLRQVEKVETRKKFQKLVHILQVMGAPFPESFDLNHYGAYSADLRAELDAFGDEKLVDEKEEQTGSFKSYTLRPTKKLLELLNEVSELPSPAWLDWAAELNQHSPRELEGISTVLYLHQRRWPEASWSDRFGQLKPHLKDRYQWFESEAKQLLGKAGQDQIAA